MNFAAVEDTWWAKSRDPDTGKPLDKHKVRGHRIGRFGIRTKLEDELAVEEARELRPESLTWRIDHIPTGLLVVDVDDFPTALAIADDISRYAKQDPASRNPERAVTQIGRHDGSVGKWIMHIRRNGYTTGYREWAAEQGIEVRAKAPRKRKGFYG